MSVSELACVYSALILHDADISITVRACWLIKVHYIYQWPSSSQDSSIPRLFCRSCGSGNSRIGACGYLDPSTNPWLHFWCANVDLTWPFSQSLPSSCFDLFTVCKMGGNAWEILSCDWRWCQLGWVGGNPAKRTHFTHVLHPEQWDKVFSFVIVQDSSTQTDNTKTIYLQ